MSRVKISLPFINAIKEKAKPAFNALLEAALGLEIDKSIGKGLSPVRGQERFAQYADSYQRAIKTGNATAGKRIRPVNLTQTGKLRRSQKVQTVSGKVTVTYTDSKASYHNEGTDTMPRRAILPTNRGEEFSRSITKFMLANARKSIDAVLRKP